MMKIAAFVACVALAQSVQISLVDVQPTFEEWMVKFGKT